MEHPLDDSWEENEPELPVARRNGLRARFAPPDASSKNIEDDEDQGEQDKGDGREMGRRGVRKRGLRIKLNTTAPPYANNPRRRHPTYRLRPYPDTPSVIQEMETLRRKEENKRQEELWHLEPPFSAIMG